MQRGLDRCLQVRLVVLDYQQVIPAPVTDRLGDVAVGEHGVAGHHLAGTGQHAQQPQGGLVLVGLGIDPQLGYRRGGGRHEGGQQVDAGGLAAGGAAQGLAVEGDGVPAALLAAQQPAAKGGLEGVDVQAAEELTEGALSWGLAAAEAQGVGEGGAVVPAELGDGFQAAVAGEDGDDGEGQDGRQGVTAAAQLTRVGEGGQDIEQARSHDKQSSKASR
jgi:hypothetical protein